MSGEYAGESLSMLWRNHRELFGNIPGDKFPLLIKIIDAKQDLSIQVHPDDDYARIHEDGSLGKTECWYILDADPGETIVLGHHAKDKQELADMIHEHRWNELIREIPVKKGDFLQIDPGTVHAIKGGTLILETQQNSDITYRVYDYDRMTDGKPRELHVEKSIDVIRCPYSERTMDGQKSETEAQFGIHWFAEPDYSLVPDEMPKPGRIKSTECNRLISCPYYSVYKLDVKGRKTLCIDAPFLIVSVVDGTGRIGDTEVKKGQHMILPNGCNCVNIEGSLSLICSHI